MSSAVDSLPAMNSFRAHSLTSVIVHAPRLSSGGRLARPARFPPSKRLGASHPTTQALPRIGSSTRIRAMHSIIPLCSVSNCTSSRPLPPVHAHCAASSLNARGTSASWCSPVRLPRQGRTQSNGRHLVLAVPSFAHLLAQRAHGAACVCPRRTPIRLFPCSSATYLLVSCLIWVTLFATGHLERFQRVPQGQRERHRYFQYARQAQPFARGRDTTIMADIATAGTSKRTQVSHSLAGQHERPFTARRTSTRSAHGRAASRQIRGAQSAALVPSCRPSQASAGGKGLLDPWLYPAQSAHAHSGSGSSVRSRMLLPQSLVGSLVLRSSPSGSACKSDRDAAAINCRAAPDVYACFRSRRQEYRQTHLHLCSYPQSTADCASPPHTSPSRAQELNMTRTPNCSDYACPSRCVDGEQQSEAAGVTFGDDDACCAQPACSSGLDIVHQCPRSCLPTCTQAFSSRTARYCGRASRSRVLRPSPWCRSTAIPPSDHGGRVRTRRAYAYPQILRGQVALALALSSARWRRALRPWLCTSSRLHGSARRNDTLTQTHK